MQDLLSDNDGNTSIPKDPKNRLKCNPTVAKHAVKIYNTKRHTNSTFKTNLLSTFVIISFQEERSVENFSICH